MFSRGSRIDHIILSGIILAGLLFIFYLLARSAKAPTPVQPIAYSHRIHAGESKLPCLFCHRNADRSPVAGVPAVRVCMGCHQITAAQKPEILKLKGYWDKGEPVPWVRVHRLPGHVRFTHKRHVRKDIACQTCHGPIETMDRVRQWAPLSMGWCVKCHEKNGADRDCMVCHH